MVIGKERVYARPERSPWLVVLGSCVALTLGSGPITGFSLGVLIKPLSEEFGWNRAEASSSLLATAVSAAVTLQVVGKLMDKYGVRRVLIPGIIFYACTVALFATVNSLPMFIMLGGILGIFGAINGPLAYTKCIAAVIHERRGLAMGLALAGGGIGAALIPPYTQYFLAAYGWRGAYLALSGVVFLVALPCAYLLIKDAPVRGSAVPHHPLKNDQNGASLAEALRTRQLWQLIGAIFLGSLVTGGFTVHSVPLLTDRGMAAGDAALILGIGGIATIGGRVTVGYLSDIFFTPFLGFGFLLLGALGLYLLGSGVSAPLGILLLGFAQGTEIDLIGLLIPRYFGMKAYGQIYGVVFAAFSVGTSFGPVLLGASFTLTGSYDYGVVVSDVMMLVAAMCFLTLGGYRFSGEQDDSSNRALGVRAS